ncbi:MIF4G-like, type 3 [Dillenia turbinata]|uniref:MIF4G-like, type 3 n=1 Tax=Dillenia turbinata TaxID=194707 RepID=A0AAN8Z4J1_9MAGN
MSLNQSRSDKSDSQYRKSGRFGNSGQHRGFSGGNPSKGGGGGSAPPPPSPSTNPSLAPHQSFKKSNNAQGGHSRVSVSTLNSESGTYTSAARTVQNGAHVSPTHLRGASHAPVAVVSAKPSDSSTNKSSQPVPRTPSSQPSVATSTSTTPTTPARAPGDASRQFPLQFGSISPNFMNGMQIPARTSSAPPNLDEQKRVQAHHDSLRTGPAMPVPSVPKQQLPRKEVVDGEQPRGGDASALSKVKKDVQASAVPPAPQAQKSSVVPATGISMPMPYHQSQVPVQFSGSNPQIQSQAATSIQLPIPVPLPMANAPQMQQQMFVAGLQSHPMQPQGIMHQGQGLSFTAQMNPQLPPQLGNMGINMAPQFPQQQAGKFGGPRRPVKITDPNTHKELRLDKRTESYSDGGTSMPLSHSNVPQPQHIASFSPGHPINYYPNSYNAGSLFFPASSVPLTSSQITSGSQAPRFNYQVNQGSQNASFINPHSMSINKTGPTMHGIAEPGNLERSRDVRSAVSSALSSTVQVTVMPTTGSIGERASTSQVTISTPNVENVESSKLSKGPGEISSSHPPKYSEISSESSSQQLRPVTSKQSIATSSAVSVEGMPPSISSSAAEVSSQDSASVVTNTDGRRRETMGRSESFKDHPKKLGKNGRSQVQSQTSGQSISSSNTSSPALEQHSSFNDGSSDPLDAKITLTPSENSKTVLDSHQESTSIPAATASAPEVKKSDDIEGLRSLSSEISATEPNVSTMDTFSHANEGESLMHDAGETKEHGEVSLPLGPKEENSSSCEFTDSFSSKFLETAQQNEQESAQKVAPLENGGPLESLPELKAALVHSTESKKSMMPVSMHPDSPIVETGSPTVAASVVSHSCKTSTLDASLGASYHMDSTDGMGLKSDIMDQDSMPDKVSFPPDATPKFAGGAVDSTVGGFVSLPTSVAKDKPTLESIRAKSTTARGKKKKKEICLKADNTGTASDIYGAYKVPEEKKETTIVSESTESRSGIAIRQTATDATLEDDDSENCNQTKREPDDWEDAADISSPNLEPSGKGEQVLGGPKSHDDNRDGLVAKKYSRDFLLKFSEQYTDLPEGFKIGSDIAEVLMAASVSATHLVDRDSYPSPGRNMDRTSSGSRTDRRGSGIVDEDKWSKLPGPFASGRGLRLDIGFGGNVVGFRPGQGANYAVLRNPRAQTPTQYVGGILSGPMQSLASQGGTQRSNSDADRWQRATAFQKGLIPSPQTPLQVMHKAEKKYEVGKVQDEEETKQRQLKAILNKLTPQNFDKLFEQVKAVNIDSAVSLTGVISQIFDKALMEPTFCEMYADFCYHLASELPDFGKDDQKITFKRVLLNKCQEEFERGEREQEEANRVEEEGEVKQSEEEREEKRIKARRRMLGNIRLIGELYKKKMLTERIMHECIKKLLGQYQNPDEEDVEALCKLMSTIGEIIDHPKAKEHMDAYFDMMVQLSENTKLSTRVRFMLRDAIDLRKNKWQQRRKVEGPKKIEEVHRDAAQERQAQIGRLPRGPGIGSTPRRGQPMDFGPRGSPMLSSPSSQMGGFRGLPAQPRGYGAQDVRLEDRHSYEGRTLSVPLPQRPLGDDSITLGPQGGLARGMSIRGLPSMSSVDMSMTAGDPRRLTVGMNGHSSVSERTAYSSREDLAPRYASDRFGGLSGYDQSSMQDCNVHYGSKEARMHDRGLDRSLATSPLARTQGPAFTQNAPVEKFSEERLREKSLSAIKEFYRYDVRSCFSSFSALQFSVIMLVWLFCHICI